MSQLNRQSPRTATAHQSIWRDLPEDTFREHLVALEHKTNAVPVPSQVFSLVASTEISLPSQTYVLPLEIEQRLADDFAYIAAVGQGAQSVSAVCIDENIASQTLIVRVAAVDAIDEQLRLALRELGAVLVRSTTNMTGQTCSSDGDVILRLILKLHFQKLLGRLRSCKWEKPKYLSRTHKSPLWQDFHNLMHRVQFIYPKAKNASRIEIEARLKALGDVVSSFEQVQAGSEAEFAHMVSLVEACYDFCRCEMSREYAAALEKLPRATSQIAAALKTLRQIEKIGAYKRIALDLIHTANQFPTMFGKVEIMYLDPYSPIRTEIGYEDWAKTLHVHAEVQLTVYYDLSAKQKSPSASSETAYSSARVIGTSKYLCYLCYCFLEAHGRFIPRNTHGRLYDQWTIPDLVDFDEEIVLKYRRVIQDIDLRVKELSDSLESKPGKRDAWRVEPMTSRQNLLSM